MAARRRNMCPRDVASESKERCDLAYAVLKFDLIPIPDYSRRTKEHCKTTVVANPGPWPRDMAARRRKGAFSLCSASELNERCNLAYAFFYI